MQRPMATGSRSWMEAPLVQPVQPVHWAPRVQRARTALAARWPMVRRLVQLVRRLQPMRQGPVKPGAVE